MARPKKTDEKVVVFDNIKRGGVQTLSVEAYERIIGSPQLAHLKLVGEMSYENAKKYIESKTKKTSNIEVKELAVDAQPTTET